ncbi:hypothetical protein UBN36_05260 [Helicobacter pylori]
MKQRKTTKKRRNQRVGSISVFEWHQEKPTIFPTPQAITKEKDLNSLNFLAHPTILTFKFFDNSSGTNPNIKDKNIKSKSF